MHDLAGLRPNGMLGDEELLEFDRERGGTKRLWIASTHAVYVIDRPKFFTSRDWSRGRRKALFWIQSACPGAPIFRLFRR